MVFRLLLNTRADIQVEFDVWQSRHGRKIIKGIEHRSKLHDEPNALKRERSFPKFLETIVHFIPKNSSTMLLLLLDSVVPETILLYHKILTDSRGMPGFQGRGRSILLT